MRLTPEDIAARILYRDEAMLVLDKPAGIAVHKGPKGGVTLDEFLPALAFGLIAAWFNRGTLNVL